MNTAVIKIIYKIFLILLAITLVYVVGFSMQHNGAHDECPVATITGGQCSFGVSRANFFETASIHLNALKRVSLASLGLFWLTIFSAIIFIFAVLPKRFSEKFRASLDAERAWIKIKTFSSQKFLDWLVVREKRDSSLIFAASA